MPSDNLPEQWLPEPSIEDNTYARRAEHTLDWLARSTVPRAKACRRFLNDNMARLPQEVQIAIRSAARNRWNSAFFELIVARILQEMGADLEIEVPSASGKRPDYTARFPDGVVVVEAIAPVFNSNIGEEAKNRTPLLNYIEANIPPGWRIGIAQLPAIGPSQSRKEFERAVSAMLNKVRSQMPIQSIELEEEISTGTIRLLASPGSPGVGKLLWEAPYATIDNSEARIRHAVKKKKQQVQRTGVPVLLAIQASGLFSGRD